MLCHDCKQMFHVRSRPCVETNITRRSFHQRVSSLYLWNMRYRLLFTPMYPCKQTNQHYQIDVVHITGRLESPVTCSDTQQDVSCVEHSSWQSFIPLWPVAYYIFLRTLHFSSSSSSPSPQQQVMAPQTPQPSVIQFQSSHTTAASSNAPLAETQQQRRHQFVHCDTAIPATEIMAQDPHFKTYVKPVAAIMGSSMQSDVSRSISILKAVN